MKARLKGPLDPLIDRMPKKQVQELAKLANVSRNTVLRWQRDIQSISLGSRLVLQLIAKQRGVKLEFLYGVPARPSERYQCSKCGERGHRSTYCPKK